MVSKAPVVTTLWILLLRQLVPIHSAQSCSFEIRIDGNLVNGDGSECFEPDSRSGIVAGLSSRPENLLVWDEDAPCGGEDESYIHYSGSSFGAMTAGAGDLVHTYRAAVFSNGLPVPEGTAGCYAFSTKDSREDADAYTCLETWRVARYGTPCPQQPHNLPSNFVAWTSLGLAVVAAVAAGVLFGCRRRRRKPEAHTRPGDDGSTADDPVVGIESTTTRSPPKQIV